MSYYLINSDEVYKAESLDHAKMLDDILGHASYVDDIQFREGSPDGEIVATKRYIAEPQIMTRKPGYYTDWQGE